VDYIKYVVENWQVGTEIHTMQEGPEKNALLHFCRSHKGGNKYIHQYTVDEHDGFNCGPIACLKVMEIYGTLPMNSIAEIGHQKHGYHGVVMDYYKRFLSKHDSDLQFILNKTGFKKITRDGSVRKNELSGGVDNNKAQVAWKLTKKVKRPKTTPIPPTSANWPWKRRTGNKRRVLKRPWRNVATQH
jgi:hypothetical protein